MKRRRWPRWLALGLVAGAAVFTVVDLPVEAGARGADAPLRAHNQAKFRLGPEAMPFPGTPDAAPSSPVIFSSLAPAELRSVSVTGSRSGAHRGRLEALPIGAGTEFVARRPFAPGERVQVVAVPTSRAGPGGRHPSRLSFSFRVAVSRASTASSASSRARVATGFPTQAFHSQPPLHPPAVSMSSDPDATSGDMFLTPGHNGGGGLMILTGRGHLVWYRPVAPNAPFDLAVQSYRGQPVLTWWHGGPPGTAADVIDNRAYHTVAVVRAANGYWTDPHDFLITPRGTAWLLAQIRVKANLSSVGGSSNGTVADSVIQEIDIATGKLLWEWHAYGHVPLNASYARAGNGSYDFFHLNSIQLLSDGNLLVSARNTWAVYKISTRTGQVLWTLGGKYNQFKLGPGTQFEWQHDARRTRNTLTLFDDADSPPEESQSSAKELHVNVSARTVTLIRRYTHAPPLLSPAQGSAQILPNANVFVGWGTEPDFSEYTASGRQLFTGRFPLGITSYRALRFPWSAHPTAPPAMAATAGSNDTASVWASWNGATNVASWRVLGGSSPTRLRTVTTKPHLSFETEITLSSQPRFLEVQALNGHGQTLGTSVVHSLG